MRSKDKRVAAAGRDLNAMIHRLIKSRSTYTVDVQDKNQVWNLVNGGGGTNPVLQIDGVGARSTVDPDYGLQKWGMPTVLTLTHEAGHADAILAHKSEAGITAGGPAAENLMRTILACGNYRVDEDHDPGPCR